MSFTLEDFEVRYKNLRESYPDIDTCSVEGCENPVDVTEGLGFSTTCAYHRLLFDSWMYALTTREIMGLMGDTVERRNLFKQYMNRLGKAKCDKLVLEIALEPINWAC